MPVAQERPDTPDSPLEYLDDVGYRSASNSSEGSFVDKDTHYSSSTSRRVLTQVLARKERDAKQMNQLLRLAFGKLDQETQRALDAERRASECLVRARHALDARALAEQDAQRTKEELGMYKVQLEQAQREIFRAQEIVDNAEVRIREAEEDAAKARSVARRLKEERAVQSAREEGRKEGWRDGMRRGWRIGYEEALEEQRAHDSRMRPRPRRGLQDVLFEDDDSTEDDEPSPEDEEEESSSGQTSSLVNVPSRGVPEIANGSRFVPDVAPHAPAPPLPTVTTPFRSPSPGVQYVMDPSRYARAPSRHRTPEPSRHRTPEPPRHRTPEPSRHRTPEPRYVQSSRRYGDDEPIPVPSRPRTSSNATRPAAPSRPFTPRNANAAPETIHPIPVRNTSPSVSHRPISIPPDGWIPHMQTTDDGHASIFMPPPHELSPVRPPQESFVIVPTPENGSPNAATGLSLHDASASAPVPVPPPVPTQVPAPSSRSHSTQPNPNAVRSRDFAYGGAPGVPPPVAPALSSHSRGSTHLSEYELLAPVDQPLPRPSRAARVEDVEDEEPAGPARPPSRVRGQTPVHQDRNREPPFRRGPRPPRDIVFPAPLAPAVEQLVRPPSRQQGQRYAPPRQRSDSSPEEERPRGRPQRSRTASSGVPGISVESPSPENSPSSPAQTNITDRTLLSPDNVPQPLPESASRDASPSRSLPHLANFAAFPPNFVPDSLSPSVPTQPLQPRARTPSRRRTRTPGPTYATAPVPQGVVYPASPLDGVAPAEIKPAEAQERPLSPLSDGIFGRLARPPRLPWRRHTSTK
ncbi:hypothetical protein DENSPDRAFT_883895 [Dentipellis sp. KUC8613]|nr:hypothetical protein DENSPDRAFT_883895 [Dentipellis sp. KUC8613]